MRTVILTIQLRFLQSVRIARDRFLRREAIVLFPRERLVSFTKRHHDNELQDRLRGCIKPDPAACRRLSGAAEDSQLADSSIFHSGRSQSVGAALEDRKSTRLTPVTDVS